MADGSNIEYEKIKGTPVLEFWGLYDLWLDKLKRNTKNLKHGR